jgi:hypothetical protein
MVALARDLVEEIAAGRAVELAAGMAPPGQPGQPPAGPSSAMLPKSAPKGAAAVYPQLGQSLTAPPGDTISGLAYAHLQPAPPPGQPGQPPGQGQKPGAPGARAV